MVFPFREEVMVNIDELLAQRKALFEEFLATYFSGLDMQSGIVRSCLYSISAGGKRLRPILVMLACEALGGTGKQALEAGLAIEMIHTFSLVHDDLPAIDNDDLRRGQPSCHKQFGEATAILAGDALIFMALEVISCADYVPDTKLDIIRAIADMCGYNGLVQGEYEDIMAEGRLLAPSEIEKIYYKKTAKLFELCMYCGGRIAHGDDKQLYALTQYGRNFGLAFQVIDDILDVTSSGHGLGKTAGKDIVQDKATLVKALDIEQSKAYAKDKTNKAIVSIADIDSDSAKILQDLAMTMLDRVI
ncbi:MAG: polyprenyl synthetase family protein [Deltaproteobacteria bacterium]|nr:polyprenyl synthetase family protein [Deltaproteobacteria bacterium]